MYTYIDTSLIYMLRLSEVIMWPSTSITFLKQLLRFLIIRYEGRGLSFAYQNTYI
jgi:hypothetical protein